MPHKPVSRAQARYFGAIAGGHLHRKGLSPRKAREMLRGTKYKTLPPRRRTNR